MKKKLWINILRVVISLGGLTYVFLTNDWRQILAELGLHDIRLLTNNPKKVIGLEGYGLKVIQTVPIVTSPTPYNRHYLETKQKKLGHLLGIADGDDIIDSQVDDKARRT